MAPLNEKFTWKHACFCAFVFKIYMKAQKHVFHVFFPISASFYFSLHHNGKGSNPYYSTQYRLQNHRSNTKMKVFSGA